MMRSSRAIADGALVGDVGRSWGFDPGPQIFFALPTVWLAFTNQPNIYEIVADLRRCISRVTHIMQRIRM